MAKFAMKFSLKLPGSYTGNRWCPRLIKGRGLHSCHTVRVISPMTFFEC